MTQVERLIRNLCEERRLGIIDLEREAIKAAPESVPWKDLPAAIRKAVTEYRWLEKRQSELTSRILKAGFLTYNMHVGKSLDLRDYKQRQTSVREKYNTRREQIQKLRTDATIASLGKSAVEASGILAQLQKDLAAV